MALTISTGAILRRSNNSAFRQSCARLVSACNFPGSMGNSNARKWSQALLLISRSTSMTSFVRHSWFCASSSASSASNFSISKVQDFCPLCNPSSSTMLFLIILAFCRSSSEAIGIDSRMPSSSLLTRIMKLSVRMAASAVSTWSIMDAGLSPGCSLFIASAIRGRRVAMMEPVSGWPFTSFGIASWLAISRRRASIFLMYEGSASR
mmetsp:Transcript_82961/g.152252  ORF Transcript_82961/g.152252 Transcript_82961/m.152252 type:complete len:207 (+) Transcript_82961:925-1545(+)